MRVGAVLVLGMASSVASGSTVYVAKPRSVGRRVPASLGLDLQSKLETMLGAEHRLIIEGRSDPAMEQGPQIDQAALLDQVASARRAHEELDSDGARAILAKVLSVLGELPLTAEARAVWIKAQMLSIELGEAEQSLSARDGAIEELLRIAPRFSPSANGMNTGLADLVLARKASLPSSGRLSVRVMPAEAELFVDGAPVGRRSAIRPGAHRLLARMKGYRAHEESFTVSARSGVTELRIQLRRAKVPSIKGLSEALGQPGASEQARRGVTDAARRAGADLGVLATLGRRTDSRFNLHVAVYRADGTAIGAGGMVTGGLIDNDEVAAVLRAAMAGRTGAPIAAGDHSRAVAAKAKRSDSGSFAGLPSAERRRHHRRRAPRSMFRSPHFWVVSTIVVAGGTAGALVYIMQDPPRREVFLDPTMDVEVTLP